MKTKISVLALLMLLIINSSFAQEKSRKQIKEEKKIEKQKQVEVLINAKEFVFVARTALPTGYRTVNLTSGSYTVKFHPDMIDSFLPFYGRAYSGVGYNNENGLKFKGKPEEFTIQKKAKNYQVNAVVKGESDVYRISMTVSSEGNSSLSINSNNRSTISYYGSISAPEKQTDKK